MSFLLGCLFTFTFLWLLNRINFEISIKVGQTRYSFGFVGMKFSSELTGPRESSPSFLTTMPNVAEKNTKPLAPPTIQSIESKESEVNEQIQKQPQPRLELGWDKRNLFPEIIEKIESAGGLVIFLP
jgi:hypothetical protein